MKLSLSPQTTRPRSISVARSISGSCSKMRSRKQDCLSLGSLKQTSLIFKAIYRESSTRLRSSLSATTPFLSRSTTRIFLFGPNSFLPLHRKLRQFQTSQWKILRSRKHLCLSSGFILRFDSKAARLLNLDSGHGTHGERHNSSSQLINGNLSTTASASQIEMILASKFRNGLSGCLASGLIWQMLHSKDLRTIKIIVSTVSVPGALSSK